MEGKPYAVASDVAKVLGYQNLSRDINRHCKNPIKRWSTDSVGRQQEVLFINESDIYRLIIKSKKPQAEKFEKWVMEDVLPSIRQHGAYMTDNTIERALADPDFLIQLATNLKEEKKKREEAERKIEHKTRVIEALTEDITLADKRQRLNSIIRFRKNYSARWDLLYKEFNNKYHININTRYENALPKKEIKPNYKSRLDYVERGLNMLDELYELACKLFETDVDKLKTIWELTIKGGENS